MADNKRIEWIDILKGSLILIVIYVHSRCPVNSTIAIYWECFYMSIFFLFAGFLRRKTRGALSIVKKSIKSFYVPYLLWLIGTMILFAIYNMKCGTFELVIYTDTLKKAVLGISLPFYVGQYWFIMTYITVQILYSILDKINNLYLKRMSIVFLTVCGLILHYMGIRKTPFRIETACIMLPIFVFGTWLKDSDKKVLEIKKQILIILFGIWLLTTYTNYFVYDFTAISLAGYNYNNYVLFYFNAILGSIIWMNIAKEVEKIDALYLQKMLSGIKFIGRNSFVVLLNMNLSLSIFYLLLSQLPYVGGYETAMRFIACILTILAQFPIVKVLSNKKLKFLIGR